MVSISPIFHVACVLYYVRTKILEIQLLSSCWRSGNPPSPVPSHPKIKNNKLLYVFKYFHVILCNRGWVICIHGYQSRIFRWPENFKECVMWSWKYEASASGPISHMILAQELQPHLTCHGWMEARGGGFNMTQSTGRNRYEKNDKFMSCFLLNLSCVVVHQGRTNTPLCPPCRFVIRVILILPAVTFSVTPPLVLLCPPLASVATLWTPLTPAV